MSVQSPWTLIRTGDLTLGLRHLREIWESDPCTGNAIELGIAYLWAKDYAGALEHFEGEIANARWSKAVYFDLAGVAEWCLGAPKAAVDRWSAALNAQYGDSGGANVKPALLLFAAAALRPELSARTAAMELLKEKAADARSHYWPGPLSRFIAGSIDEPTLRKSAMERQTSWTDANNWLADFYKGLIDVVAGDRARLGPMLQSIVGSVERTDADDAFFRTSVRCEEFFLARHEMEGPRFPA